MRNKGALDYRSSTREMHDPSPLKKILLPYVIVPVFLLSLVTFARAWMEITSPSATLTKLLSPNTLGVLWILVTPFLLMRKGMTLLQGMAAGLLFLLFYRLPIGFIYAMAWAGDWTVQGTLTPVCYVTQTPLGFTTMEILLLMTVAPLLIGLLLLLLTWKVTHAIFFRSEKETSEFPKVTSSQ